MTVDLTARLSEQSIRARAELRKKGLRLPPKPTYDMPRLKTKGDDRLADLEGKVLMDLLVMFTRWQDYIDGEYVMAEIDESVLVDALDVAKMSHIAANWTGASADRVRVSNANAAIDANVRQLSQRLIKAKAWRKALGVLVESLDRDAKVVSREITRRDGSRTTERRAGHWEP
jgi:hypothetical protein